MGKWQIHLYLTLLAAVILLPGLGIVPLFDWDELSFAEAAREMWLTKNWLYVQIGFEPFWEKPPLFIAIQSLCSGFLGDHTWVYRLPNAVAGIVAINFCFHVGETLGRRALGIFWALAMLTSFGPLIYWKSGIIDPVFNLFIILSLWHWYKIGRSEIDGERSNIHYLLSGVFMGLAILTKGQTALMLFTIIVGFITLYRGRWQDILTPRIFIFALAILLLVGGWVALVYEKMGDQFFVSFIHYQMDLVKGSYADWHTQPWFYHIVVLLFIGFPASPLAIKYLVRKGEEDFSIESWHFLMRVIFWVVLIVFSIVSTKIIHYSSLCWWPITYFGAYHTYMLHTNRSETTALQKTWLIITSLVWVAVMLGLGAVLAGWKIPAATFAKFDLYTKSILGGITPGNYWVLIPALIAAIGLISWLARAILQPQFHTGTLFLWSGAMAVTTYFFLLPAAADILQNPLAMYIIKNKDKGEIIESQGFRTHTINYYGKLTPKDYQGEWLESPMVKEKIAHHPYPMEEARKVWVRDGQPKQTAKLITKNTYKPDEYFLYQFNKVDSFSGYWVWKRK